MEKSNVFSNEEVIRREICGRNLMNNIEMSMVQIITDEDDKIVRVIPCCKGKCDKILQSKIKDSEGNGFRDLITFVNPYLYINNLIEIMDRMFEGRGFQNQEAFNSYSNLILNCYNYVSRDLSEEEIEISENINLLPI